MLEAARHQTTPTQLGGSLELARCLTIALTLIFLRDLSFCEARFFKESQIFERPPIIQMAARVGKREKKPKGKDFAETNSYIGHIVVKKAYESVDAVPQGVIEEYKLLLDVLVTLRILANTNHPLVPAAGFEGFQIR